MNKNISICIPRVDKYFNQNRILSILNRYKLGIIKEIKIIKNNMMPKIIFNANKSDSTACEIDLESTRPVITVIGKESAPNQKL